MTLTVGDQVPDLALLTPSGDAASLADLRGRATLLVFLRHLG